MTDRIHWWTVAAVALVVVAVYSGRLWAADAVGPPNLAAPAPAAASPMADEAVPALAPAPPGMPVPAPPVAPEPALRPEPERWPTGGRAAGVGYACPTCPMPGDAIRSSPGEMSLMGGG